MVMSSSTSSDPQIQQRRLRACYPVNSDLLIRYRFRYKRSTSADSLRLHKSTENNDLYPRRLHQSGEANFYPARLRRSGESRDESVINNTIDTIKQRASSIKQLAKDLQKFYVGRRLVKNDRNQQINLIALTQRSQQLSKTEVALTSAKLVSDIINWMNDMIAYEQRNEKLLEQTIYDDLLRMQQHLRDLECQLWSFFILLQEEVQSDGVSGGQSDLTYDRVKTVLSSLLNRRAHFWRDLVILKETEELMNFITATINP